MRALVTGAGKRLGREMALYLARRGYDVAVHYAGSAEGAAETVAQVQALGRRATALQADLLDEAQVQALLPRAIAALGGPITVLVNNAANDQRHDTLKTDQAFWDWSIDVNLRSYFFACQSVIPGMQAAGGGSIINFSSISFMMADTGYAAYITANAGIIGLTRTLAREFGPDRIRVNAIAPGWVLTDRQKQLWVTPDALASHLARQCLPDPILPADMAGSVLFLAADASRMMTSQTLILDGGFVSG